jgi:hypothetical protein
MYVYGQPANLNQTFRTLNVDSDPVVLAAEHYWHSSCDTFVFDLSALKSPDNYSAQLATIICGTTNPENVIMMLDLTFDVLYVLKVFRCLTRLRF